MKQASSHSPLLISLHWLSALLIAGVLIVGWTMGDMPHGAEKNALMSLHQTLGVLVLVVAFVRLVMRRVHGVPPHLMESVMDKLAALVQVGLYGFMIWVPVFGYLTSSFGGHPVRLFGGAVLVPALTPENHGIHEFMGDLHQALAYVMLALVALHVAGALKHHFILKDDILARMVPWVGKR